MAKTTALMADPIFRRHLEGRPNHPERPERYDVVMEGLTNAGLIDTLARIPSRPATEDELLLCHAPQYLEIVRDDFAAGMRHLSTGDTDITPTSFETALHAVGGVLNAVDAVMTGAAQNAFCAVRPPGHHANARRGMGFCLFNNVAIAARHAQKKHGVDRIVIIDWDVHHGNGTQDIFYGDSSVFFFSSHQWPLYPGTGRADEKGESAGKGTTMNFPLPAGSGRSEVLGAVRKSLVPVMDEFRPDLVLISAGFDSRIGDLLGRFTLTDEDFNDLTNTVLEIAERHAGGRLVSLLEGGYALPGLASAATSHVAALSAFTKE